MKETSWVKILGLVTLTIIVSFTTVKLSGSQSSSPAENSVYDQVLKSGTIRSCYVVYPPDSIKDPNSGKLSGVFVDTLEKTAENMGLKVSWNAEVGWGELIEALNTNRCDVVGSGIWSNSARGKSSEFTQPVFYSAINAYVRADDHRFDSDLKVVDNGAYIIASIDGETAQLIAQRQFPNAQTVQLPQLTDVSQMLLNVANGKADMAFIEPTVANAYMQNNPGEIRQAAAKPVAVYGNVMLVKKGEFELKSSLDNAINELLGNGYIDDVLDRYEKDYPGGFYRVALPYVISSSK